MKKFVLGGEMRRRIAMTVGGVLVSGFSVGMFQFSTMGMDPFQTFAHGLSSKITFLGYGSFYMILSLLFLAFDLIFMDRKKMGIATFINLFLLGYVVEFSSWLWNHIWPDPAIWLRIIMLALGVLIMCVGSSLYFVGDLGVSVYDAIALTISERKKWRFFIVRITSDIICVAIGAACGVLPGVGTIVTALGMGPLIEFFNRYSRVIRYGKNGKPNE